MYSFKVSICKFNQTERKNILGIIDWFLGGFGRSLINIKDLGTKAKYFQGTEEFSFRDLGRSRSYY